MEITDLQFAAAQEYKGDVKERFAQSYPTTIIQNLGPRNSNPETYEN